MVSEVPLGKSTVDQKNIFYGIIYLEQIKQWFEKFLKQSL